MSRATAKVFKTGRSQAVRIPKDFRFDCDEVFLERRGRTVIITPKPKSFKEYFKHSTKLSQDFPDDIDDYPPEPVEEF